MADDEYEILPHQLLNDLKYDVEALKKKLTEPDTKMNELILEIESLKDSIHELNTIFQKALEDTKGEDATKILKIITERLDAVVSQNETIAKGMIAVSDKVEEFVSKQQISPQMPLSQNQNISQPQFASQMSPQMGQEQHIIGPPPGPMGGMGRMAPPPNMDDSMRFSQDLDFPPPPPNLRRRPGMFK